MIFDEGSSRCPSAPLNKMLGMPSQIAKRVAKYAHQKYPMTIQWMVSVRHSVRHSPV